MLGRLLVYFLFKLDEHDLLDKVTPLIGVEYSFCSGSEERPGRGKSQTQLPKASAETERRGNAAQKHSEDERE
jgi:hypothetical protein